MGTPVTSSNPATQTNTSLAVALASTTAGDLNVVEVSGFAAGATINPTMTTPSGWTKLLERIDTNGTPASFVAVYYRAYQSGDGTAVTVSWTNAGQMVAVCTPWSGQDGTTPIPYSVSDFKVASDVNYSIAGTTGTDQGFLCYGFANRTGSTWSSLTDNARGQVTITTSATMVGRVTAAEVAGGTAFTKTAVGSNTSVGVSWAFVVKGASSSHVGTASGGFAFAGTASGSTTHRGTASGGFAFTRTTAAGSATHRGTASGGFAFAGAASGSVTHRGTASGGITWTATASGAATHRGSASGTVAWSGSAVGAVTHRGTASGTITWSGTASGVAPTVGAHAGVASGGFHFTGTAAGAVGHAGHAVGTVTWAGAAVGSKQLTGSATGTVVWAGAANGTREPVGSATGTVAWAGTAVGTSQIRDVTVTAALEPPRWAAHLEPPHFAATLEV
jgi:hypothetical protein